MKIEQYFNEKQLKIRKRGLYVLKLCNGNFYVGTSTNIHKRIEMHLSGSGAKYTQHHPPVQVVSIIDIGLSTAFEARYAEEILTIEYMLRFGCKRVRGSRWVNESIDEHSYQELSALSEDCKRKATAWREFVEYGGYHPAFFH